MTAFRKLMVANRGEIAIRVFRSSHELGIRTVAIYSHEDRFAIHRLKADEAYEVGKPGEPIRSYLNIEAIVELAKAKEVDAIHPGYGFLSENAEFARACAAAGIVFVGPRARAARPARRQGGGTKAGPRGGHSGAFGERRAGDARARGPRAGPVARFSGDREGVDGGWRPRDARGRVARGARCRRSTRPGARRARHSAFPTSSSRSSCARPSTSRCRSWAISMAASCIFTSATARFSAGIRRSSRWRRRTISTRPCARPSATRRCGWAGTSAMRMRGPSSSWWTSRPATFYFIEVNPRIQVEHTVTEIVTNVDLVKSQILIAAGKPLSDPEIDLPSQDVVQVQGYALQCRVTTEDPENKFTPDYGRITHYRSVGGLGIRIDGGPAVTGGIITPFYDSLLVKICASGRRFIDAARRMERALEEFRVRGVKTNIPFLLNLLASPDFLAGNCTTRFIDENPELFPVSGSPESSDAALDLRGGDHGQRLSGRRPAAGPRPSRLSRKRPGVGPGPPPPGSRQKFLAMGADAFSRWVREHEPLLLTDTTFRDAHQSLLATRVRTRDMLRVADAYARLCSGVFSIEMWGGATFDTAMRFLKEDPWERLAQLREKIPNILFQMLLRGSNAVGYTSYPDNVVKGFVKEAAAAGIDLFRVFDSLNWVPNMELSLEAVREAGALCEAAICYTGDILNPKLTKYDLAYYVDLAKELEKRGANLIAIKDMAGLCKPKAAERLIAALRQEVGVPIHFHTHDIGGAQAASVLLGAQVGLDVADGADRLDGRLDVAAQLECDRRIAAVHAARHGPRPGGADRDEPVLGRGARAVLAV